MNHSVQARFEYHHPDASNGDAALIVDLELPGQGVTAIFGPSGSGKTTLLRCMAGLARARGQLVVNDQVWQRGRFCLAPHKRPLGYVFQEASLFEHLTVQGNLQYAINRADGSHPVISAERAIGLLGIGPLLGQHPDQLSGGERQRVAMARALLINPALLLLDEPLAALDLARKREILPYLERLRREVDIPILYVSHAADEVARLADHLVVMEEGRVVASGPLQDVLTQIDLPIHLGEDAGAVVEATVDEQDAEWHLIRVGFDGGSFWVRDSGDGVGERLRLRILARDVSLARSPQTDSSILNSLQGRVEQIVEDEHPAMVLVRVRIGQTPIVARITRRSRHLLGLDVGQTVWAQIKSVAVVR
ncbi:molybdenum ABC transporter ATP-binding protein [Marinobacteraceae bacterium S3BR75-40.1]